VATLSLACTAAALHIPAELATAPRLPVKGRQGWLPGQHLKFGEYEARRRESLLTQMAISAATTVVQGVAVEPFGFGLRMSDRELWNADCDPFARDAEADRPGPLPNPLRCTFAPVRGDTTRTWRLVVLQAMNRLPHGDLVGPDNTRLDVLGTARDARGVESVGGAPLGYHIVDGTRTLAAVEVTSGGAVWFDPGLAPERRDLVAAVAAALLLWDYLIHEGR
jgi:hypothetical protein